MSGAATSPFGLLTGAVRRALRWVVLGCLALSACQPVHAASLVWTNLNILGVTNDATYLFTPTPQPGTSGGALATGGSAAATTTNGIGTVSLLAGRYTVRITGRDPFVIWVPNASGPYNLTQLYRDANGGVVPADAPFLPTTGGELTGNLRFSGVLSGGVIPPHLTTAQRDSLNTVSNGMLIFNVTLGTNQVRGPGGWFNFPGGTDTNQFATLATLTNVANAQAQAALQSSTNYTDGIVGLYTLLSTFESATNTLTGLINSAGVSAETATNIARSVVAQSNLVNQSQLSTATGAVYAAIPDTSTLATKAALEATNAALVALIDSETASFINAAQATNIAAYQALIVSNGVTLLIPSTNGLASIPFVTATSNALQSQIGSAGISAETSTNIARAVVGQSNLVNAAQVAAQIASSNLVTASITNDLASIEYARSLTNNFATQAYVTAATNTLDGKFAIYTTLTLTTNIANAVGQVVSNAVVLLIPSTNGFITLAQLTVASNALQTQIDAIDGVTSAEATNIAASVVGGSNYVTLATLNTSSNAIRAAIPSTNGFVTQTITNGLASIYFVQAVSNWVPTQIQSTNGLASTNWVAAYNYHAQTNGVLPRWAAETLTADGRYGVNLNSSDGEINLLSSGEIALESSTGIRLATSSGIVNVENSDLTVDGNFVAGGAMFGSAGTGLTNIHWPGPGISNVVAGDGILLSTNTGVLVIESTGTGGGSTNGITGTQATNIVEGLLVASNYLKTATFNTSIAAYTPLTLATNLRTLVILTNAGATFLSTNASQITAVINTNVSGGGSTNGLASIEYVDDSVNGASNVLYGLIGEGGATLSQVTNTVNALAVLQISGTSSNQTINAPTFTNALEFPSYAADLASRGITNKVFWGFRTDGRDGLGTEFDPRNIASVTLLSNAVRNIRSGTEYVILPGEIELPTQLALLSGGPAKNSQSGVISNSVLQASSVTNVVIRALHPGSVRFYGTNGGNIAQFRYVHNFTLDGIVFDGGAYGQGTTNDQTSALVYFTGGYDGVTINKTTFRGGLTHGLITLPLGGETFRNLRITANWFENIGRTNHPTLTYDGEAFNIKGTVGVIATGNVVTNCLRGMESFTANYQTSGASKVTLAQNQFLGMWQHAINIITESPNTGVGVSTDWLITDNLIEMAPTFAIPSVNGNQPIIVAGGASRVKIANNTIRAHSTTTNNLGIHVQANQGDLEDIWVENNTLTGGRYSSRAIQMSVGSFTINRGLVARNTIASDYEDAIWIGGWNLVAKDNVLIPTVGGVLSRNGISLRVGTNQTVFGNTVLMGGSTNSLVVTSVATNSSVADNLLPLNHRILDSGVGTRLNPHNSRQTFEESAGYLRFQDAAGSTKGRVGFPGAEGIGSYPSNYLQLHSLLGPVVTDGADTNQMRVSGVDVLTATQDGIFSVGYHALLIDGAGSGRFGFPWAMTPPVGSYPSNEMVIANILANGTVGVYGDRIDFKTATTTNFSFAVGGITFPDGTVQPSAAQPRSMVLSNLVANVANTVTNVVITETNDTSSAGIANGTLTILNQVGAGGSGITSLSLIETNNTGTAVVNGSAGTVFARTNFYPLVPTVVTSLTSVARGIAKSTPVLGSEILYTTNHYSEIATNVSVAHLDYGNSGKDDYYLQPMRGNITIYLTNLVAGRSINLFLYGSTNASDNFTATFSTNNTVGRLRWNIYSPTNGLNVVTVTNNLLMEFSLKALPNGEVSIHPGVSR